MAAGQKFLPGDCMGLEDTGGERAVRARALLAARDLAGLQQLVEQDGETGWLDKSHILHHAVQSGCPVQFIQYLVAAGASTADLNMAGLGPAHLAAQRGNAAVLVAVGEAELVAGPVRGGYTPLHFAAEAGHTECVASLLAAGVDVDVKDSRGATTPLLLAVRQGRAEAARLLVESGACLDLQAGRATLREHFQRAFPDTDPASIPVTRPRNLMLATADKMFRLIQETELQQPDYAARRDQFATFLRCIRSVPSEPGLSRVLDLACKKGLHEHADLMLTAGADINSAGKTLLEAAYFGHYRILKLFKKYEANLTVSKDDTGETVLHLVLKMPSKFSSQEDYEKCLDECLDRSNVPAYSQIKSIINKKDSLSNTALHYATQKWPQSTVRRILESGANIGIKNHWRELPITKIRPETMEGFLSEFCLTATGDREQEEFSITFRYEFLAPDCAAVVEGDTEEGGELLGSRAGATHALPETEPLWYMSRSKEHRHLLKHPVITSFLWYKWHRIRKYFNRNIRFTILFVFLLTWHIFRDLGKNARQKIQIDQNATKESLEKNMRESSDTSWYVCYIGLALILFAFILKDWILDWKNLRSDELKVRKTAIEETQGRKGNCFYKFKNFLFNNMFETIFITLNVLLIIFGSNILQEMLSCLLVMLLLREILQMSVSLKRYFSSIENLMEILILGTVTFLLTAREDSLELKKHLAAFVIVMSWSALILLLGRHPKLKEYNIYLTMFFKVMKTFLLFLTWYSLFIIAFGLGFFILLHKPEKQKKGEGDYEYFDQVWLSLVKTTTMFVGELEFSDWPVDLQSRLAPLAYIFFLSFVFLIVVVLMNLLNGLAVSDTGIIREKAEIFSYRSQVETISTFESMLLGDPFDFLSNVPSMLAGFPSFSLLRHLYRNRVLRKIFNKIGAAEILLFYDFLPSKSVSIRPNRDLQNCGCLATDEMGRNIIKAATEIITRQKAGETPAEVEGLAEIKNHYSTLQSQVQMLEMKIDQILNKLK